MNDKDSIIVGSNWLRLLSYKRIHQDIVNRGSFTEHSAREQLAGRTVQAKCYCCNMIHNLGQTHTHILTLTHTSVLVDCCWLRTSSLVTSLLLRAFPSLWFSLLPSTQGDLHTFLNYLRVRCALAVLGELTRLSTHSHSHTQGHISPHSCRHRERIQKKTSNEKRHMKQCLQNPMASFQECFPDIQDTFHFFQHWKMSCDYPCETLYMLEIH